MITITKFIYHSRCDVNMCKNIGEHSVGEDRGPKTARINYCTDHLMQIAKAVIEKFPDEFPTGNIAELESKDRKIEELTLELKAKTTAHECLKEQLEKIKNENESKPKPKPKKK